MQTPPADITPALVPARRHRVRRGFARGFTLYELVMVLGTVAIISAVALPRYGNAVSRYRAEMAARRLAADLTRVRANARTFGAARAVTFDAAGDWYEMPDTPDPDRAGSALPYRVRLGREPYGADLVSVDLHGAAGLSFDAFGFPNTDADVVIRSGPAVSVVRLAKGTGRAVVE